MERNNTGAGIRLAVRAHDVPCRDAESLCGALRELGVRDIQLAPHKSFPGFDYTEESVAALADVLRAHGVRVAVYGCYIDPAAPEGEARFLRHIRFAEMLGAQVIATETGVTVSDGSLSEETYARLVRAFRAFVREADGRPVTVAAEAVAVHPIATPDRMRRLLDDVPGLAAVFDPENLRMNGTEGEDPARRALSLYGGRVAAVHWKRRSAGEDAFVADWLEEHPEIPLITEELTGEDLRRVLDGFRARGK